MARKVQPSPRATPIRYCLFCRVERRGQSLLKHCIDAHDGQLPLIVCTNGAGEYEQAAQLLRKAKLTVTTLPAANQR